MSSISAQRCGSRRACAAGGGSSPPCGLAAVAGVLDRVDGVEVAREADRAQHFLDVVPRRIGEHQPRAAQAQQRVLHRVLVHHHVGELGEDVGLGQKWRGDRCRGGAPARERGAVGAPELSRMRSAPSSSTPNCAASGTRLICVVHRREDAHPRVVQRVVEVEDPDAPRRRQPRDPRLTSFLRISVPTPWSVSTSRGARAARARR